MPKDNIFRAISKSEITNEKNFENLRYEGFGPFNVALIIETLTDNKNRAASSLRTVLQKNGGRLGETGSTKHLFNNFGIIRIEKTDINEEEVFEIAINSGAKDCNKIDSYYEIITEKDDYYKVKTEIEKRIDNFAYSGIEWRASNKLDLKIEQKNKLLELLNYLEDLEDVQKIFTNVNFNN